MSEAPPARRRRHDPLAAKFSTPDERREYFAGLGRVSNAGRVTLSHEETQALSECYRMLARIAQRHGEKLGPSADGMDASE